MLICQTGKGGPLMAGNGPGIHALSIADSNYSYGDVGSYW